MFATVRNLIHNASITPNCHISSNSSFFVWLIFINSFWWHTHNYVTRTVVRISNTTFKHGNGVLFGSVHMTCSEQSCFLSYVYIWFQIRFVSSFVDVSLLLFFIIIFQFYCLRLGYSLFKSFLISHINLPFYCFFFLR